MGYYFTKKGADMAQFISHKNEVTAQVQGNINRALVAMGITGVASVKDRIDKGYYETYKPKLKAKTKAIRQTGDLRRSMEYQLTGNETVAVGTNMDCASYVHEGTRKMKERPFIKDGIDKNSDKILEIGNNELKKGMS